MTATTAPAPAPKNDIFGVCRRLGEDFGFHPNILRVALAIGLIWSIEGVFAAYVMLGVIVLISRVIAPQRHAPKPAAVAPVSAPAAAEAQDVAPVELARAA